MFSYFPVTFQDNLYRVLVYIYHDSINHYMTKRALLNQVQTKQSSCTPRSYQINSVKQLMSIATILQTRKYSHISEEGCATYLMFHYQVDFACRMKAREQKQSSSHAGPSNSPLAMLALSYAVILSWFRLFRVDSIARQKPITDHQYYSYY